MDLRPATESDVAHMATLMAGDETQASTRAAMGLFGLKDLADVVEVNRVMIGSTGGWEGATIADDGGPVGFIHTGGPFLALTPEVAALAHRLYGDDFERYLGERLTILGRVQAEYPEGCLHVSEIHVSPTQRGAGIGRALMDTAIHQASASGLGTLALQTLTTNPARHAFEAWGFTVAETRTDPEFEAIAGAPGYQLMLRET